MTESRRPGDGWPLTLTVTRPGGMALHQGGPSPERLWEIVRELAAFITDGTWQVTVAPV